MNRKPVSRACKCLLTAVLLLDHYSTTAQPWEFSIEHTVATTTPDGHVAASLVGELLAISVCSAQGGVVQLRSRHTDGLDQWGVLDEVTSSTPWFGHALALRDGRLAIGVPGYVQNGQITGATLLAAVDPSDVTGVLSILDTLMIPDPVAGDHCGYACTWAGDTLLVGLPGRASFRGTGAVAWFPPQGDGQGEATLLQPDAGSVQLPFGRWFGAALAYDDGHLAVAAPFSGFRADEPRENIGAVHLYEMGAEGWLSDTVWYDLTPHPDQSCAFERMELGRWGIILANGRLYLDRSSSYAGYASSSLGGWLRPDPGLEGCAPCGTGVVERDGSIWPFMQGASLAEEPDLFRRGREAWTVHGDLFHVSRIDPSSGSWSTTIHARNEGGDGNWGVVDELTEIGDCDAFDGPMAVSDETLVRVSLRRGGTCALPGQVVVTVQFFHH